MSGFLIQKPNKQPVWENRRGSLLLEALLATVILSLSITMVIQSMTAGLKVMTKRAQYVIAIDLLENKMAAVMRKKSIGHDVTEEGRFPEPYAKYQYFLTASPLEEENVGHVNKLYLKVAWDSGKGTRNIGVATYLPDEL